MEQLKLQDILESDKEMILENIAADSSPAAVVNVLDRELDRMLYRYAEGCPDENAVTAAGNMIKSIKNSLPFMEAVDDVKEWKLTGDTEENKRKLRLAGIILTILLAVKFRFTGISPFIARIAFHTFGGFQKRIDGKQFLNAQ